MEFPHVIRIHQAAGLIESPGGRTRLGLIAEMPLAEDGGFVTGPFEYLAHGGELRVKAARPWRMRAEYLRSAGIATRHQGGSRGRTDGLRHVKVVVGTALTCKAFNIRSGVWRLAKWPEIGVSGVVEEDDDDIGWFRRLESLASRESEAGGLEKLAARNVDW